MFNVHQTVRSSADLNYVFAGYQYDMVSGTMGHLGLSVGGAYLGTSGSITSVELGTTASKTVNVGLPLAGAEGRLFPWRGHKLFVVGGDIRGMDVGSYGHYLEVSGSGGVGAGPVTILAGYRTVRADLHASTGNQSRGRGCSPERTDIFGGMAVVGRDAN